MARPRKKGNLTSSQRTDFERQIFALCLKNEEFKKIENIKEELAE